MLHVMKGHGAPTMTPTSVGQHYIDVDSKTHYHSVGTSSPSDWKESGGSSGLGYIKYKNGAHAVFGGGGYLDYVKKSILTYIGDDEVERAIETETAPPEEMAFFNYLVKAVHDEMLNNAGARAVIDLNQGFTHYATPLDYYDTQELLEYKITGEGGDEERFETDIRPVGIYPIARASDEYNVISHDSRKALVYGTYTGELWVTDGLLNMHRRTRLELSHLKLTPDEHIHAVDFNDYSGYGAIGSAAYTTTKGRLFMGFVGNPDVVDLKQLGVSDASVERFTANPVNIAVRLSRGRDLDAVFFNTEENLLVHISSVTHATPTVKVFDLTSQLTGKLEPILSEVYKFKGKWLVFYHYRDSSYKYYLDVYELEPSSQTVTTVLSAAAITLRKEYAFITPDGNRLVVASDVTDGSGTKVYYTDDGTTFQLGDLIFTGGDEGYRQLPNGRHQITSSNTHLYLKYNYSPYIYRSTDGLTWEHVVDFYQSDEWEGEVLYVGETWTGVRNELGIGVLLYDQEYGNGFTVKYYDGERWVTSARSVYELLVINTKPFDIPRYGYSSVDPDRTSLTFEVDLDLSAYRYGIDLSLIKIVYEIPFNEVAHYYYLNDQNAKVLPGIDEALGIDRPVLNGSVFRFYTKVAPMGPTKEALENKMIGVLPNPNLYNDPDHPSVTVESFDGKARLTVLTDSDLEYRGTYVKADLLPGFIFDDGYVNH